MYFFLFVSVSNMHLDNDIISKEVNNTYFAIWCGWFAKRLHVFEILLEASTYSTWFLVNRENSLVGFISHVSDCQAFVNFCSTAVKQTSNYNECLVSDDILCFLFHQPTLRLRLIEWGEGRHVHNVLHCSEWRAIVLRKGHFFGLCIAILLL